MIGLGKLRLLVWFDLSMLAALLVCCAVAGHGLDWAPVGCCQPGRVSLGRRVHLPVGAGPAPCLER